MWSMWNATSDRDYYDQFAGPEPEEVPDHDPSCPMCLGDGALCTACERPISLCDCEQPKAWFCGMCQGTGSLD